MLNTMSWSFRYSNKKVIGGLHPGDYDTYKTIFAGPDPADPTRVLVRKLVKVGESTWAWEESRISQSEREGGQPTVHTTLQRLGWLNIDEPLSHEEYALRLKHWSVPNVIGYSMLNRAWKESSGTSWSLVENTMSKQSSYRWQEWWNDFQDKRSMAGYLVTRWWLN